MNLSFLFPSKTVLILSFTLAPLSLAQPLFDLHHIYQSPDYWWNETIANVGTILGCSQFCQVDRCIGFSMGLKKNHSCTLWNTERKEPIFVGTSNAMFPIWLKNGKKSSVFRLIFRNEQNFTLENTTSTIMKTSIPDLYHYSFHTIHQSFDWGMICCNNEQCYRWICGSDSWSAIAPLNKYHFFQRDHIGLINNKFWIIGGWHNDNKSYAEYLNSDDTWILASNLSWSLHHFGIAWIKGSKILIAGGEADNRVLFSNVYKYDIHRGTWTPIGNFAVPTVRLACERHVLSNGTTVILCAGGKRHYFNGTIEYSNQVGVFNINTDTWTMAPEWDLPVACMNPMLLSIGERLFIFGGLFEDDKRDRVLEFRENQLPIWQEERTNIPKSDGWVIPTNFTFWSPNED